MVHILNPFTDIYEWNLPKHWASRNSKFKEGEDINCYIS